VRERGEPRNKGEKLECAAGSAGTWSSEELTKKIGRNRNGKEGIERKGGEAVSSLSRLTDHEKMLDLRV